MIERLVNINGYQKYRIPSSREENSYFVYCLDGRYLCQCALDYNRNINILCRHIKIIKEWLKEKESKN